MYQGRKGVLMKWNDRSETVISSELTNRHYSDIQDRKFHRREERANTLQRPMSSETSLAWRSSTLESSRNILSASVFAWTPVTSGNNQEGPGGQRRLLRNRALLPITWQLEGRASLSTARRQMLKKDYRGPVHGKQMIPKEGCSRVRSKTLKRKLPRQGRKD